MSLENGTKSFGRLPGGPASHALVNGICEGAVASGVKFGKMGDLTVELRLPHVLHETGLHEACIQIWRKL